MSARAALAVMLALALPSGVSADDAGEPSAAEAPGVLQSAPVRPTSASEEAAVDAPPLARAQMPARSTRGVEEIELDATAITGYEELPRIMHIVPWKPADLGEIPGRPVDSLLNDIIAPVDRQEYRRQLRYHDALYGDRPDS